MKKLFILLITAFLTFGLSLNAASKEDPVINATGLIPRQLFNSSENQPSEFPNPGNDPSSTKYHNPLPYMVQVKNQETDDYQIPINLRNMDSMVQVGNQEAGDYQIPINLYYMDSMVEVVYLQEWLGSDMLISTVSFHMNITSTLTDEFNLEIWLGETDETDLSAEWIDGTNMSQVFDGTFDFPTGEYWINFPLDTSFVYTYSGNLVMMIIRDDDEYYSTADLWWCTESNTPYRTRHAYTDNSGGQEFNAITGPFTSTYNKSIYPDIRFYYSTLEHGDVEGVITDNATSNPIDGVEVYVGNWGPATTNALGEYLLEDIVTGLQPVSAFIDGYYDFFGEVEVLADVVVTYDIGMDANLFGGLDGIVTDADTGALLTGAEINAISLGGYEYDAVTNDDGYYSIVDVVAETYDVYCSFTNYPTHVVENVVVTENLVTTVDFMMEGYPYWNNFEDNDGGFISNNPDGWQWGIPLEGPSNAYSGIKLWGTVLDDNYPSGANLTLDTPVAFQIPFFNPTLSFWHWYDTESSYDGGNIKVSTDGINWEVIIPDIGYSGTANSSNPLSGEPIFTGHDQMFWEYVEFDLSSHAGQNLIFRWHFGSDSSTQYPGWYIDDFSLAGYNYAIIYGTVTEFGTGTPIEGATVSVDLTSFSDVTNESGEYEIVGIEAGIYNIICEAPLYLSNEVFGFSINTMVNNLDFSMLWSEISVNPEELICHLPPDTVGTQTFFITNNGPGDLEYNITVEYTDGLTRPENWLGEFNNVSGTIPGNGGTVEVLVGINSADLIAGEVYTANLLIHNNSNYGGDFILPITLIVGFVNAENDVLPIVTKLHGNYPNPFNPVTNISYSIKEAGNVTLEIYNLRGQLVKTLVNEVKEAGNFTATWNGTDNFQKPISSGVYLYKMNSGNYTSTKKMILLK